MATTNLSLIVVIIVASVYLLFYQSSNKDFQGYYTESYDNEYQIDAILINDLTNASSTHVYPYMATTLSVGCLVILVIMIACFGDQIG
jgi:hypothetical protein